MTCVTGARRNLRRFGVGILGGERGFSFPKQQSRWCRPAALLALMRLSLNPLAADWWPGHRGALNNGTLRPDRIGRKIFLLFYRHPRNKIAVAPFVG